MHRAHQTHHNIPMIPAIWCARRTLHFCDWKNCPVRKGCLKIPHFC
ncbi:hypothetical protein [Alysiella crassa]|nr:hypothetical protein [Alysiella crassa]UOP07965.1 hypothetical protein LVJ80_06515 [Alysiella crassa]